MATNQQGESPDILTEDLMTEISASKNWSVLAYGLNERHFSLLSGIMGKKIPAEKQQEPNFSFEKNEVVVTAHFGSNLTESLSHENVDLLLHFIPIENDIIAPENMLAIKTIVTSHGPMIWKNSVIVLTGLEDTVARLEKEKGKDIQARFETLMDNWTKQIQGTLKSALSSTDAVAPNEVLIRPAANLAQPDLPKPHEKWFSLLWHGCFLSSKLDSMPAILKISQDRISYDVKIRDIIDKEIQFHDQSILTHKQGFSDKIKLALGIGGGGAVVGAAATGAAIGALIGALAIGIPSFGVAAGTGLVLGGVIGGGAGAGIAGAVISAGIKVAQKGDTDSEDPKEESDTKQKLLYGQMVTCLPEVKEDLTQEWARKRITCRIAVVGMTGEGVSTVAASLADSPCSSTVSVYKKTIFSEPKSILEVYDFGGFSLNLKELALKAKEVIQCSEKVPSAFTRKDCHLLVYCIPMTVAMDDFVYSFHLKCLERLFIEDDQIFTRIVIALTHGNEMHAVYSDQSEETFKDFFEKQLEDLKQRIRIELAKFLYIPQQDVDRIPIVVTGKDKSTIVLSEADNDSLSAEHCWLSELLLQALAQTRPNGLPVLIKACQKRLTDYPSEYPDTSRAHAVLVDTKCSMFSQKGLERKESLFGEAIGHILGVNENRDW